MYVYCTGCKSLLPVCIILIINCALYYYVAGGSFVHENPGAEVGQGTWTGTMVVKRQSVPRMESEDAGTTTFVNESRLI